MKTTVHKTIEANLFSIMLLVFAAIGFASCDNFFEKSMSGDTYRVYDVKMINELMEEQGLTDLLAIVDKAGYSGTISAYGTYTFFGPTNEAIKSYLAEQSIASIDDLSQEHAENFVKYHIVKDTIATTDFIDGRLASPTFAKKYLTTKYVTSYIVNRQAEVIVGDVRGDNGILHVIDHVLIPPTQTITDAIRSLPDSEYSLMKEFFEHSGLADSLAICKEDYWFTFFVQDNQAFADAGITSLDDLLIELKTNTPAIEDNDSLISNYIAYHGINSLKYIADLMYISSLQTLVPKQVITFKRNEDAIILNELNQGQLVEPGVEIDRASEYSDLSCANGVIHKINGNIQIKNRSAYRIYWDIAEQPEIMALKNFRKAGASVSYNPGELSEITWQAKSSAPDIYKQIDYYCGGYSSVLDEKFQYVYGDYLRFNLNSGAIQWVELQTPVLVEGKYKVWLCYRRELECKLKSIFKQEGYDDQVLPYIFDLYDYMPNPEADGASHELIEIDGWKQYNAKKFNSVVISHLLGIIDVQTTGRHVMRFEPTTGGRVQQKGSIDMIQFIPVDDDQLWPRVDIKGNWIYSDVPNCQIYPQSDCGSDEESE